MRLWRKTFREDFKRTHIYNETNRYVNLGIWASFGGTAPIILLYDRYLLNKKMTFTYHWMKWVEVWFARFLNMNQTTKSYLNWLNFSQIDQCIYFSLTQVHDHDIIRKKRNEKLIFWSNIVYKEIYLQYFQIGKIGKLFWQSSTKLVII